MEPHEPMSGDQETRLWIKDLLQKEYEKITFDEGEKFTYLGMVLTRTLHGYEISMRSYIEDILEIYARPVPAKMNLFMVNSLPMLSKHDKELFHSVVAKLLYLGKRGQPDILLSVQFMCTRVKAPTDEDRRIFERVLVHLKLMKNWSRFIDKSAFERVETYIDASFKMHANGKSQSGCMTFWGKC